MPREVLTDEQVADIRAMVEEGGQTLDQIASQFGTSKQHVSRIARGEQRQTFSEVLPGSGAVRDSVADLLNRRELDASENVQAAVALALAEKLDACRNATTAQAAIAAPGLARALKDLLEDMAVVVADGPRFSSLRGEEAVLVARQLGYPDPEYVDVDHFDQLEILILNRRQRLARDLPDVYSQPSPITEFACPACGEKVL